MRQRTLAALFVAACATPAAAQIYTVGSPIQLPADGPVARHVDGGFLLAYAAASDLNKEVVVQRYTAAGIFSQPQYVNLEIEHPQVPWELLALRGGDYVVLWQTGYDASTTAAVTAAALEPLAVSARFLDPDGIPVGPELRLDSPGTYAQDPAAAALSTGGFVVTWAGADGLDALTFDAEGRSQGRFRVHSNATTDVGRSDRVAALPDGGFVVVFARSRRGVFARRYARNGAAGPTLQLAATPTGTLLVAADGKGGYLAVWNRVDQPLKGPPTYRIIAQRVGPHDELQGPPVEIDPTATASAFVKGLTMEPDGRFVMSWQRQVGPTIADVVGLVQAFDANAIPFGPPLSLGRVKGTYGALGTLVRVRAGEWLVTWSLDNSYSSRSLQRLRSGCGGAVSHLCLLDGRFRVEVKWELPDRTTGEGQALPITHDSGAFWFFGSENPELLVKVVDGQAVNGHFWVLFGALSDVEYTITVIDTATGAQRSYTNPAGTMASRADTQAF